jgi:diguanylate cyclase (GGDEF)-like protein
LISLAPVARRVTLRLHESSYWWFALVCAFAGCTVDVINGVNIIYNAAYAAFGLVAFVLVRARLVRPLLGILAHMIWAMLVLVFESHVRFDHGSPDNALDQQAVAAFLLVGTVGVAIYGGLRWAALGLTLALVAKYHLPSKLLHASLLAVLSFFGVLLHAAMERAETARKQLEAMAFVDSLTGLPNRRAVDMQFESYRAIAERNGVHLMLMVWDVDGLKTINDKEGHLAGDTYLQTFCAALKGSLRAGDVAFRIGGDEFVTLHLGLSDAALVTERVRAKFARVSVGSCAETGATLEGLLRLADEKMYADKAARRQAA